MSRSYWSFGITSLVIGVSLLLILTGGVLGSQGDTERVNVSSDGTQAYKHKDYVWTGNVKTSADGRFVAFESEAANLVPGDTNGTYDIFVRDRVLGTTERVSVSSTGEQANYESHETAISADGRYVAFMSFASNLVEGDTWYKRDVFVRDRLLETTERVSVTSTNGQANGASSSPSISADGRYVAFRSDASNLVDGDTNGKLDIFVRDRVAGTTERVSISYYGDESDGSSYAPSISADGRYVAFESDATTLDNMVDGLGHYDIFVHDRETDWTDRVSISLGSGVANGGSSYASISADGHYIAFQSYASNLVENDTNACSDVFIFDMETWLTECVSVPPSEGEGNSDSYQPSINADGRYVAFNSYSSNLIDGDTNAFPDVFVRDLAMGITDRISISSFGEQGNNGSYLPSVSGDGRYVAFASDATNLVTGDTNDLIDAFVHQYGTDTNVTTTAPEGWLNAGWNYFSIPLDTTGSAEASELLGFACRNILYQWDAVRKNYELYPDDFDDLERGRGYILRLAVDQHPSYEAYPANGDFEIAIPKAGWNLIGQPFDHDTLLADLLIRNNTTGETRSGLADKAAGADAWANWNLLWWYSAGDSWKLTGFAGADDDTLHPWYGYLFWANVDDLTLIVPES